MRLVLIDSRIDNITGISGSFAENTEYILFDYLTDTIASIQDKITNTYESVAIIQHNYKLPTYQLVSSSEFSEVLGLEIKDPNLDTWKEYIEFLVWLKTERGAEFIDLMACDLWADPNWRYMIETVRARDGVYIRASLDTTGAGGNFVLESDGVDMIGVYFTEKILEYKYAFYTASFPSQRYQLLYTYTLPLSNPGTIKPSPYSNLLTGFTFPTITNVISVVANIGAIAVLRTDGTVAVSGLSDRGGAMPCGVVTQSQLVNISKVVAGQECFAALKKDGTVICWGTCNGTPLTSNSDINNTPNTTDIINVDAVRSQLVNIVDIYATGLASGFAALTNTGKVITWGFKVAGGNSSSVSTHLGSGIVKVYVGYRLMVALNKDAKTIIWGNNNAIVPSTFARNYPIIDVLLPSNDNLPVYICITPSGDTAIYKHDAASNADPLYTLPAGVRILRKQWLYASGITGYPPGCYLMLSNETVVVIKFDFTASTESNVYNNAVDVQTNQETITIVYKDSTVVSAGNSGWGGSKSDSVYGLWSGANTSNAFRLASTTKAYCLLKTDKTVVWWGIIGDTPSNANLISGTTYGFKTVDYGGKITSGLYGNLIAGNIASIYTSHSSTLVFSRQNNQGIGIVTSDFNTYNRMITKPIGTNVYFETAGSPSGGSFGTSNLIPIEIPYSPKVTPYFVVINKSTSITYYASNPDNMAYEGRTYRLYYGATLIDTFIPTSDTHTYVFSNVTMTSIGKFTLEIFDYTMGTPVSMDTFPLSVYNYDYLYSVAGTVNTSGTSTSVATLANTRFNTPGEIAFDSLNNMYIADTNNHVIRVVPAQNGNLYGVNVTIGNTYVVTGTGSPGTTITNGVSNLSCTLNYPYGVAFDSNDNMFISDTSNHVVRVISKAGGSIYGVTTTANQSFVVAGTGTAGNGFTSTTQAAGITFAGTMTTNTETNISSIQNIASAAITSDNLGLFVGFYGPSTGGAHTLTYYTRNNRTSIWSKKHDLGLNIASNLQSKSVALAITPDGKRIVIAAYNDCCYYIDANDVSFNAAIKTYEVNPSTYNGISMTEDGKRIVTVTSTGIYKVADWNDLSNNFNAFTPYTDAFAQSDCPTISRDGSRMVFKDTATRIRVRIRNPDGNTYGPSFLTLDTATYFTDNRNYGFPILSPDARIMFVPSADRIFYSIWDGSNYGTYIQITTTTVPGLPTSNINRVIPSFGDYPQLFITTNNGTNSHTVPFNINSVATALGNANRLTRPRGIIVDSVNNLYIADSGNHVIKVISGTGGTICRTSTYTNYIYTILGTEGSSGSSANAVDISNNILLNSPYDILVDSSQNLFISDTSNNVVRVVPNINGTIFNKTVSPNKLYIVAGNASVTSTSGVGSGILATDSTVQLYSPRGLAVDENKHLFISDSGSHAIRVISNKTGKIGTNLTTRNFIYTLIGTLNTPYANGDPTNDVLNSSSRLNSPSSCVYNSGEKSMYISDTGTHSVRQAVYYKLPTVPGSPIINSLIGGNTTLTLTYSAGDDGGFDITNYYYAIKDGNAPQSTYSTIGSSPQTLSNLKNGNTYTVSLVAQNSLGNSTASTSTAIPYTFPSTPNLTSISGGNSSVTVSLDTTVFNGGNTYTTYYYSTDNGNTYSSTSGNVSNPYTISGLTNGNRYTVRLITTNYAGNSSPSNSLTATAYTTPDKPIISSIISGNAKLMVSLDPTVFNGGNAYTNYYYSTDNSTYTSTLGNLTNPYTIKGLTNGDTYNVSFITRNIAGNSSASDPVTAIPSFTTPNKPIITSIQNETNRLLVSLDPTVFDGGDTVTNYYYSTDGGNTYTSSNGIVTNPYAISGLNSGNTYSISIITQNPAGNSIASDSVTATYYSGPNTPTLRSLIPKNGLITVKIIPPADIVGPATTDYYYNINGKYNYLGPFGSTSYDITGLASGFTYTIFVTAKNAIGNSSPSASLSTVLERQYNYLYTVAGNVNTTPIPNSSASISDLSNTIFSSPGKVAFDSLNNMYVADTSNHVIRVRPAQNGTLYGVNVIVGNTYVVAGTPNTPGTNITNGVSNLSCTLNFPYDVEFDPNDNMFISDTSNHVVRVISKSGGSIYGVNTTANQSFVVAGTGTAGTSNMGQINTISYGGASTESITTNTCAIAVSDDGTKMIYGIQRIPVSSAGVGDLFSYRVYSGTAWSGRTSFGIASAVTITNASVSYVAITPDGTRVVCGASNFLGYANLVNNSSYSNLIQLTGFNFVFGVSITEDGKRIVICGSNGGGSSAATMYYIWNETSNLFGSIQEVATGTIVRGISCTRDGSRIAGRFFNGGNTTGRPIFFTWNYLTNAYNASYNNTLDSNNRSYSAFCFSPDGNVLFAACNSTDTNIYYAIWNGSNYGTFTSLISFFNAECVSIRMSQTNGAMNLYSIPNSSGNTLYTYPLSTTIKLPATFNLNYPRGIVVDASNRLYIADTGNHVIRVIQRTGTSLYGKYSYPNTIYTILGFHGISGTSMGNVFINSTRSTLLNTPYDIALDSSKNLFVADSANHAIRVISNINGNIFNTTVEPNKMYIIAGNASVASTSGIGSNVIVSDTSVRLFSPRGVAVDGKNNLFISDTGSHTLRVVSRRDGKIGNMPVVQNYIYTTAGSLNTAYINGNLSNDVLATSTTLRNPNSCTYNIIDQNIYISDTGTNSVRQAVYYKPIFVPGRPIIDSLTGGNANLSLSFSAPESDGGDTITNYYYSLKDGSGPPSTYTIIGSTPQTSYVISNLKNGNTYTLSIIAENSVGNSITSNATAIPITFPSTPIITSVTGGNTTLSVTLDATVFNGGNAITTYFYSTDNGESYTSTNGNLSNPYTISGLTNGNTYAVSIISQNTVGNSNVSANVIGVPYTTPDKPIISSITGGNAVLVVTLDSSVFNGGNTYTTYYYSTDNGNTYISTGGNITNPYTINSGLTNGNTYVVSFITSNFAGNSAASDAVSATPLSVPSAPVILAITPGNNTFDVSFGASVTDGGSVITDYQYSLFPDSSYVSVGPTPTVFPVPDLSNGTPYTIYMIATNAVGNTVVPSSATAIPRTVPDAPTINTLIPKNGAIDISFNAPDFNGGNAITDYKYSFYPDTLYNSMGTATPTTYTVPGLDNGNTYTIYVKATNAAGDTLIAANSTAIPRTVPGAPDITDVILGNTTVDILFNAPSSDGGNAITDYAYSLYPADSSFVSVGPNPTQFTITDLSNGTPYTIYMKAYNDAGNTTIASNVVVIPRTVPDAPVFRTVTLKNSAVDITFEAPADDGGNAITNYWYSLYQYSSYVPLGATPTTYTVSPLDNGNTYTIYMKATNAAGNTLIESSTTAIPRTVPDAPDITDVILGNTTVDISFNAPSVDGGNAITDYRYSFFPDTSYNDSVGSSPTRFTIRDLSNGTPYTIYMKAYNAAGNTLIASNVVAIPRTVPGAPEIKAVTLKDSAIDISFGAPIDDGGNAITEYKYSYLPESDYNFMSSTPTTYTVSLLNNGTPYTIYLKAFNSAGNTITASFVNAIPRTVPDAPIITTLIPKDSSIDISFNAPTEDGGNAITDYKYSFYPDTLYNSMGTSIPTTYTVPGLDNGNTYTIYVKATNAAGDTLIAANSTAIPRTVPGAPDITDVILGNTTIDISFNAPFFDGGNAITDYRYSFFPDTSYNDSVGSSPTQFQIPGLTNGNSYTIYMKAYNAAGNTIVASNVVAIPRTVPDAPDIQTVTLKDSAVDITFGAPSYDGGNAITNYWYSLYQDSSYVSLGATPTTYTVSPLYNGTSYTIYMKATNAAGNTLVESSTTVIPRTVPGAPDITDVILGNTTVDILFNAPSSDGGNAITDYRYSFFPNTSYDDSVGSSPTQFQIPGLTNGNSYTIYMKAYNAAGNTTVASNVVAIPRTVPDAPVFQTVTLKDSAVDITFEAPADDGGNAITNYWYSLYQYSSYVPLGATPTTYTVSPLDNGNTYTIYMKATNAAGNTLIESSTTAIPRTVPDAPEITHVILGNTTIDISFNAPSSDGGNTITDYRYSFFPDTSYNDSVGSSPTRFPITGLTNGNSYTIYMKAYNAAGNTIVASNVVAVPRTIPGAPIINAIISKNASIDITFSAPNDNGGNAITDYAYSLYPDSSYNSMNTATPTTYTIPGLRNGTLYTIYLKAYNAAGNTAVASSDSTIPKTFPGAPIINSLTAGDQTVDISFSAPLDDGGNTITDYAYSFYSDSSFVSMGSTPTTYTVPGLINGETYTFYLRATNSVGNTIIPSSDTISPLSIPGAPVINSTTPGNTTIDISFARPINIGGSVITDYKYSFSPNSDYVSIGPVPIPLFFDRLTNGIPYTIYLKATNAAGDTAVASSTTATPRTFPDAPIINTLIPKDSSIDISFNAPTDNGGNTITDYKYSLYPYSSYISMGTATPTTYTVPGLENGNTYIIYVKATNAAGDTLIAANSTAIPRTVPDAPDITHVILGNTTVDISFNAPSFDGGNAITDYRYSFFPDSSYNDSVGSSPTRFQIPGLSNGNSYTIYMKAYNAAGNTIVASNVVAIPRTVPDAPDIQTVTLKDSAIDILFGAPTDNGGNAITDYAYSFYQDSSYVSVGPTPRVFPITDLSNGISYTIYMKAYNAAGNTITASSVTAIPRTVPDAPIINTLIPKDSAIDISFNAPSFDGGNAITDYAYSFYPYSSYNSIGSTPTTYTVPGLDNGNTYTIYLRATNAAGDTLIASNSTAIPRRVPDAPNIRAVTLKNTAIDISFGAPAFNGGNAITDYAYSFFPDSSYISVGSTPRVFPITDLSNGISYTIYMKAYNAAGNTLIASNTTAIPRTVPDAPIINTLIPKDSAIDISFNAPAFNGGNAITDYKYSLYPDTSYNSMGSTPTTYTLSPLYNGTSYTIYLKATNAAGDTLIASNSSAIPRTVPDAPIITDVILGNTTVDISFNAPSFDGGNAITEYKYSLFPDTSYNLIGPSPTRFTIRDLSNGIPYTIYLKAYNAAGNTIVASNTVAIPRTVPDAPIINRLIPKNGAIDISFNAPAVNGGNAITDYAYSLYPDTSYNSMGATPTTYTVPGLSNGNTYTIYLKATNAAGNTFVASSAIAIPRTVPGAPIITTFIPGNTTIDISFNAPSFDGGNAITEYAYSFFPDTSYNSIGPVPIQYQITDLSNGTPYTIYLKAYNAAGNTIIASNAVAIPRTVPGAPEIKAVTLKDSAIDISFGAPISDGGNAITEYKYSYFQDSAYISMGTSPTTYTVSPLTNGISYIIYLKAYNAAGNTITASSVTATPRTVPGAPIINTLVPKNGSIDISFNAPASNGGNAITEYKYSFYPDSSYNSMGAVPTTYPVPGLENGNTYTIYLKAFNAAGNTVIASSGVVTPRTVPGAPQINAVTVGNTIIDISFGAPISNGGNTVTNYWYSFYPDSSYNLIGPSPTTYTVSRLTNGTSYTIYLKASNAAGISDTASSVTAIPKTFPRAPIITSSTPGDSSITISFNAPSDNGGNAITEYSYSYYSDSSYSLIGPSPTTFSLSGLNNGESYTVYLKATNSVGSTLVASSTTLTPRTVPNAPTIDTIIPINSALQVSILPPSNNGGSSVTGYYYTVDSGTPVFASNAINTVFNITGLVNGNSYTINVLAENAAGLSVASAGVSSIPYTIPGSPLVDNIVYTPNTITFALNEPTSNGGNSITGYYYVIGNSSQRILGNVAGVSYTISELANSRNTTVYIYAQNVAGYSAPYTILSQNVSEEPEVVPNIIRFRSAFSNNLSYYKPGSLTTSGGGSGVANSRAIKLRT